MTITEVSKKYGISKDTLRYYEKQGLIPPVNRKESGIRDYSIKDCQWVEFIKCMRSAGLPIEVLSEYVNLFMKGDKTVKKRKELLISQRDALKIRILEMHNTLDRLNYKIKVYNKILVPKERELSQD